MNINQPRISDIIWNKRATCSYRFEGLDFIGALDGLYAIDDSKSVSSWSERLVACVPRCFHNKLRRYLGIATYNNGIIAYRRGKVIRHITEADGLTSNSCRAIQWDNRNLWVGTDKGLNCIKPESGSFHIKTYSSKDGFNCDIINCLLVIGDTVYLGTPYGIIYFNPKEIDNTSIAYLHINSIRSKKQTWDPGLNNCSNPKR